MPFPIKKREIITQQKCRGAGDLVAMVAEPIKNAINAIAPEIIQRMLNNCGCNKRREALNRMLPFK